MSKENRIAELKATIRANAVTAADAEDALNHHLSQLERLGAHFEDDVCCILRKVIAAAGAAAELEELEQD